MDKSCSTQTVTSQQEQTIPWHRGQKLKHTDSHITARTDDPMAPWTRVAAYRQSHHSKNRPSHGTVDKRCSIQTVTPQQEQTIPRHHGQEMQHTDSHTTASTDHPTAPWTRDAAYRQSQHRKTTPSQCTMDKRCSTQTAKRQLEHTNPWHRRQDMQHTQPHGSKNTPTHGTVDKRYNTMTATRQKDHTIPWHRGQEMQHKDSHTTARTHQQTAPWTRDATHRDPHVSKNTPSHGTVDKICKPQAATRQQKQNIPWHRGEEMQHSDSYTTERTHHPIAQWTRDAAHRQPHGSRNTQTHGTLDKRCTPQTATRQQEHTIQWHREQEMQHTDSHTTAKTHHPMAPWTRDAAHKQPHDSQNTPTHGTVDKRCSTQTATRQPEHTNPWRHGQEMQHTNSHTTAKTHHPMAPWTRDAAHKQPHDSKNTPSNGTVDKRCSTQTATRQQKHTIQWHRGQEMQHTNSHTTARTHQPMAPWARDAAHKQSHDSKNTPTHGTVDKRCSTQTATRQQKHTIQWHRGQEMQHTNSHTTARTHQPMAPWTRDAAHKQPHDSQNTPTHGAMGKRCSTQTST